MHWKLLKLHIKVRAPWYHPEHNAVAWSGFLKLQKLQDPGTRNLLWHGIRWGAIWDHANTNLWYSTPASEATQICNKGSVYRINPKADNLHSEGTSKQDQNILPFYCYLWYWTSSLYLQMYWSMVLSLEVCSFRWILCFDNNSILKFSFIPLAAELMYSSIYSQKFVSVNIEMLRGTETMGTLFSILKAIATEKPDIWNINSNKQSKGGWTRVRQCRYQAPVEKIKFILLAGF